MLLNHVNYKMPIYKDCTLGEMMFVGFCTFLMLNSVLALLSTLLFGFAWIGFSLSILLLVYTTRFLLGKLQKVKYGKPYGYYQQLLLKKLQKNSVFQLIIKLPYIERQGKWSVRRSL